MKRKHRPKHDKPHDAGPAHGDAPAGVATNGAPGDTDTARAGAPHGHADSADVQPDAPPTADRGDPARPVDRADAPGAAAAPDAPTGDATRDTPPNRDADQHEADDAANTTAALTARIESLEDRLLRARADAQNMQRRAAIDRADAVRYANAAIMKSLVVVLDDFERSLAAGRDAANVAAVVDGERLIFDNLLKALREHGMETIDALHEPFDPALHEAMMMRPTDEHPPGTVVEEIARGYRLRDRVIRPAKVVVARAPDANAGTADTSNG